MAKSSKTKKVAKSAKRLSSTAELVAGKRYRVIHQTWGTQYVGKHTRIMNDVWIGFAFKGAPEPEVFIHHQFCCIEAA